MRIIPVQKNCIGTLLKDNEAILKLVEKKGGVRLAISDDTVLVDGESADEWNAEKVVQALSYGFNPKKALKLFSDDYYFEIIDLRASLRGKAIDRYKARIIGTRGKAKKTIQELTGAGISIGEDTVAIMGTFEELQAAKEAVMKLLEGATHSTVYGYLQRLAHEKKIDQYKLKPL